MYIFKIYVNKFYYDIITTHYQQNPIKSEGDSHPPLSYLLNHFYHPALYLVQACLRFLHHHRGL